MNIALRILVILTLILNGGALWFAQANYSKRNLLIDRNEIFKNFTLNIAKTFETEDAPYENTAGNHTARDTSPVTLATADIEPDKSDFWESYKENLENTTGKHYSADNKQDDLTQVYKLDEETKKPEIDGRGDPITDGAPMQVALNEIQDKAMAQFTRLNTTRAELTKTRTELEDTISELNTTKKDARQSLKTISERDATISTLESDKSRLEGEKSALEEEKTALEEEKATLQTDLDKAKEDFETLQDEANKLRETLKKIALDGSNSNKTAATANLKAGLKGIIARVDNEKNFCIVKVSEEVLNELLGVERNKPLPKDVDFMIRSKGSAEGEFIGKIRLRHITQDPATIICDILSDWKQGKVHKGDEVIYLD